jgi:anti-anti-sigma regulatory factor
MLRVTITEAPEATTIQLEGRLVGPWAQEAMNCWQRFRASHREPVRVDLTGVTMIDHAGKSLLVLACAQGAQLVASGCLMRAIIAEIADPEKTAADVDNATPRTTYY